MRACRRSSSQQVLSLSVPMMPGGTPPRPARRLPSFRTRLPSATLLDLSRTSVSITGFPAACGRAFRDRFHSVRDFDARCLGYDPGSDIASGAGALTARRGVFRAEGVLLAVHSSSRRPHVIASRATLDVPAGLVRYLSRLLAAERRRHPGPQ